VRAPSLDLPGEGAALRRKPHGVSKGARTPLCVAGKGSGENSFETVFPSAFFSSIFFRVKENGPCGAIYVKNYLSPTAYFSLREEKYAKDAPKGEDFDFSPLRNPLIETTKGGNCGFPLLDTPFGG